MNNHGHRLPSGANPGHSEQSALSLLVNAADSRGGDSSVHHNHRGTGVSNSDNSSSNNSSFHHQRLAESLRLRVLTGGGGVGNGNGGGGGLSGLSGLGGLGGGTGDLTLEEQLLLHQQGYNGGGGGAIGSSAALLNQLREQSMLSQQQQLAALLGLGGGGGGGGSSNNELRQALAAAQFRQSQAASGLTQADILALSRSGALSGILGGGSGLGSVGGGGGPYGSSGSSAFGAVGGSAVGGQGFGGASGRLASELEGLQRLEELNHRQRLLAASSEAAMRPAVDRSSALSSMGGSGGREAAVPASPARSAEQSGRGKMKHSEPNVPAVASSVASDPGKDELEKTPGSVIVPCRARGMPMDHNFKTAYFVIPENVKHGEELICSYFACRNAGIKFRYCSHCKVPVAKRNFRKRHKHGDDAIVDKGDDSGGEEDVAKKGIPSQITASREEAAEADGISSQSADSVNGQDVKNKAFADMQQGLVRNSVRTFEADKIKNKTSELTGPVNQKISAERQSRWVSLLSKRPSTKDSDTMSAWLMEVLAVSDLETPLKPGEITTTSIPAEPKSKNEKEEEDEKDEATEVKEKVLKTDNNETPKDNNGKQGINESLRRDIDYGSSNDGSGDNSKGKEADNKKTQRDKTPASPFNGGIIKKKRPSDLLRDGEERKDEKKKSDSYVSGSFAEWKERKKQRKAASTMAGIFHQEQV